MRSSDKPKYEVHSDHVTLKLGPDESPANVELDTSVPWLQYPCPSCGAASFTECVNGASCLARVLLYDPRRESHIAGLREATTIMCDGCRRGRPLLPEHTGQDGNGKPTYSLRHPDSKGDVEGEWSDTCFALKIHDRIRELESK